MELAEPQIKKVGSNQYQVSYGSDDGNHVEFEQVAVLNQKKTEEAGCPQFDNKDFIKIRFPGDKTKIIHRPVTVEYQRRYPKQWEAYKNQEVQVPDGFKIEEWPILTKAEAANFKSLGIHTVEMLANMPDTALSFFGAREYRQKAQNTLSKATDGKAVLKLQNENAELRADLAGMKEQLNELTKQKKDKK